MSKQDSKKAILDLQKTFDQKAEKIAKGLVNKKLSKVKNVSVKSNITGKKIKIKGK